MSADVLYIEDDMSSVRLMEIILMMKHFRYRYAMDGIRGLQMIEENPPDVLLLDINLPGMSGIEICRTLRENPATANLPIIAVTASTMENAEAYFLSRGFTAYAGKPVDRHRLYTMIEQFSQMSQV